MLDTPSRPHFVSVPQAARTIGVGRTTFYGMIGNGTIHPVKLGKRTVVSTRELAALAARLEQAAGVPGAMVDRTSAAVQ